MVLCAAALLPGAVLACGANAPGLDPWPSGVEGLWWVRAERGDADACNRGVVSNLLIVLIVLIVRDGPRVWAVASGPRGRSAERWLRGSSGQLGPLSWWRVQRAWRHAEDEALRP